MKKIALVVVLMMLVSVFAVACTAAPAQEEKPAKAAEEAAPAEEAAEEEAPAEGEAVSAEPLEITFVSPLIGLPVWLNAKYGAEAAAEEIGATVYWVGPDVIDIDAQVQQVELAIAEQVDGIICCPLNPAAFEVVYKQAMDKDIPVVNTAVDSDEANRLAYIGTDYVNFGTQAAEALAEKTGGEAKIAVIQTSLDSGNQNAEREAFEAVIAEKYPNMEVITVATDDSDMTKAVDTVNTLIDAYPEMTAIWCVEATGGPAAGQVLSERGMTEDIIVLAIDDTEDVLGAIEEGKIWGTMTQDFYKMGYESVKMIAQYHAGDAKNVPSISDSGTTLVTIENLEEYKAKF